MSNAFCANCETASCTKADDKESMGHGTVLGFYLGLRCIRVLSRPKASVVARGDRGRARISGFSRFRRVSRVAMTVRFGIALLHWHSKGQG